MKISYLATLLASYSASSSPSVAAFSPSLTTAPTVTPYARSVAIPKTQLYQSFAPAEQQGLVNIADVYSPRDVHSMEAWATQNGMQKAPGVELFTTDGGNDYSLMAQSGVAAGQTAVFVPSNIVLNSMSVQQEFGPSLQQAEAALLQFDAKQGAAQYRLPLFRLMVKILVEYEKGQNSLWYSWLNSLPRQFYNGVSMTNACFRCLPPYAGWLAKTERINYAHFAMAVRQQYVPLRPDTVGNRKLVKWAYNVAFTRFHEIWQPERAKVIGPMADMLNHASSPNCQIVVDPQGNMQVQALFDIPAGSPLTISNGDPTNPTPIFAQYGFLPQDCATIFCKAMHLEPRIRELGYDFKDLLFQTQTGEVAPKVWDVFLYDILLQSDPGSAQQFVMACQNNDEGTKQQYQGQYFAYTLNALKQHVYSIMNDCQQLTMKAQSYDQQKHPRVPVIVAHNQLVYQTFSMTAALLEQMG